MPNNVLGIKSQVCQPIMADMSGVTYELQQIATHSVSHFGVTFGEVYPIDRQHAINP